MEIEIKIPKPPGTHTHTHNVRVCVCIVTNHVQLNRSPNSKRPFVNDECNYESLFSLNMFTESHIVNVP